MHHSATIHLNTVASGRKAKVSRFFYPLSACVSPEYNQKDPDHPVCSPESAYPAAPDGDETEIWSDKLQTCSFLYVDECVESTRRLMDSGPANIGLEEMVTINQLTEALGAASHRCGG